MIEDSTTHTIASNEASSHVGSGAIMDSILGFHLHPLIALLLVIALILITPWCLRKIKGRMPDLLKQTLKQDQVLSLQNVLILDNKRRLFAVKVRSASGEHATVLLLTGGPTDICVGWLGKEATHADYLNNTMEKDEGSTHVL